MDRSAGIVAGQSVEKSQRSAVHIHNGGVQEDFYSTGSQVGGDELAPLSIASRRCDTGPDLSCEGLQRREEQRPLEDRFLREEVRQSGPCATTLEPASGQQSQFLPVEPQEPGESLHRSLSTSNRERLVPIDVFTMQDRPHRFALEIFAGSSRLCNALNDHKVVCFPVDNCLFESHNVLHKQIEEKLSFWIRSGRISMVWLGMPCTTFSRARKNDGLGPGPLRSDFHLWGLPELNYRDRRKVEDGNRLLAFLMRILHLCEQFAVPYIVENPFRSPSKFKLQSWWPQALYRGFHFSQANPEMKSRPKIL